MAAMDLKISALLAGLETFVAVRLRAVPSLSPFALGLSLFVAHYLLLKAYRAFIYPTFFSPLRHLPGPSDNHPLVGQAVKLFRCPEPNDLYLSWMRQWPNSPFIRYLSFGNTEVLLVNSVSAVKEVMQNQCYSFAKPDFFRKYLVEYVGNGLVFSEGDAHKKQRRMLTEPFNTANIKKLLPVFKSKGRELSLYFNEVIDGDRSHTSGVFEAVAVFSKISLDVIGVTALGVELNNLSAEGSTLNFKDNYHRMLVQPLLGKIVNVINPYIPLRWLPFEGNMGFVRARNEVESMIRALVRERYRELSTPDMEKKRVTRDLLSFMIEASLSEKKQWSEQEVFEQLLQFVGTGHETVAMALVFATHVLATRPDVQTRLRDEILSMMRDNPEADYTAIISLPYLNNFCREVLRLYSPILFTPREAVDTVVVDGITIPKGTPVVIVPEVIQVNSRIWGSDAAKFDPDRWDRLSGGAASPFAFQAFNNGPRMCIAKMWALLEIKTFMVEMLSNFILEPASANAAGLKFENPAVTLTPAGHKLDIRVRRLERSAEAKLLV